MLGLVANSHARGKVIGSVVVVIVVSTKIAQSQEIGVGQNSLCHQMVESHKKLSYVCFILLRMALELYKSCVFTGHANQPHLSMPCASAVSIGHARSLICR